MHTQFSLSYGETLSLTAPGESTPDFRITLTDYGLEDDWSWGLHVNSEGAPQWGFFTQCTPGSLNFTRGYRGAAQAPQAVLWRGRPGEPGSSIVSQKGGAVLSLGEGPFFLALEPQDGWQGLPVGQEVVYTLNGAEPNGWSYAAGPEAIPLTKSTVLRTRCQAPDCLPSQLTSCSFIFRENIVGLESGAPPDPANDESNPNLPSIPGLQKHPFGFPWVAEEGTAKPGPQPGDCSLDSRIVWLHRGAAIGTGGVPLDEGILPAASVASPPNPSLLGSDLPSVLITADVGDFLSQGHAPSSDTTVGVTWIPPHGAAGTAAMEMKASGRSGRLQLRAGRVGPYDEGAFYVPGGLFPEAQCRNRRHFDALTLRRPNVNEVNQAGVEWTFCRQMWTVETHRLMGISPDRSEGWAAPACRLCHLYINGLYWGHYVLSEIVDKDFLATRSGSTPDALGHLAVRLNQDEYEVFEDVGDYPTDPEYLPPDDLSSALEACAAAATLLPGEEEDPRWEEVLTYFDVPELIDYMLLRLFVREQNWSDSTKFGRRKLENFGNTGWRHFIWDTEDSLHLVAGDTVTWPDGWNYALNSSESLFAIFHQAMAGCRLYRKMFRDRAHALLSPGGLLHPTQSVARWEAMTSAYKRVMWSEAARWRVSTHASNVAQDPRRLNGYRRPSEISAEYDSNTNHVKTFLQLRPAKMLEELDQYLPELPE